MLDEVPDDPFEIEGEQHEIVVPIWETIGKRIDHGVE